MGGRQAALNLSGYGHEFLRGVAAVRIDDARHEMGCLDRAFTTMIGSS